MHAKFIVFEVREPNDAVKEIKKNFLASLIIIILKKIYSCFLLGLTWFSRLFMIIISRTIHYKLFYLLFLLCFTDPSETTHNYALKRNFRATIRGSKKTPRLLMIKKKINEYWVDLLFSDLK